jgi:hypothetical protein
MAFRKCFQGRNLRLGPPEWVYKRGILFKINFIEARQNFVLAFSTKRRQITVKTYSEEWHKESNDLIV